MAHHCCCGGLPLPGTCYAEVPLTLLATIAMTGGCACGDGAEVTLNYQGIAGVDGVPLGGFDGLHTWQGVAPLGSCGVDVTIRIGTPTSGGSSGCSWNYRIGCSTGALDSVGALTTDPDPFHLQLSESFGTCTECSGFSSYVADITPP